MGMPNTSLHAAQIKQARPLELSNNQMEHEITCEHDVPDMADARSITYVPLMHLLGLACLGVSQHRFNESKTPMLLTMSMT